MLSLGLYITRTENEGAESNIMVMLGNEETTNIRFMYIQLMWNICAMQVMSHESKINT